MPRPIERSLSRKLLRTVLLYALLVGVALSCAQIFFDAYKVRGEVDADAQQILSMFREPSTQAIYSLDRQMALQVIEGMFNHEALLRAVIGHPDEMALAEKLRPLASHPLRWLTDAFLAPERAYSIRLEGAAPYSDYYGELSIALDTSPYGREFLTDSAIILGSGMLRAVAMALILYMIYQWLLTKPLSKIVQHLSRIDPSRPGAQKLPMLVGNEKNELGLWIDTANDLLDAIQHSHKLHREAEDRVQRLSRYDFLTGLPNRQQIQLQLDPLLESASRHQRRVAVLCVGLDDFKGVNEKYGYEIGDQLLVLLADRLRMGCGNIGTLARLGGDQFALVQSELEYPYEAAELAQRMLDEIDTPFPFEHESISLRATIGITLFPEDGDSAEKLLQKAEQTMTLAKVRSRNRYQFYIASVDLEMRRRRTLEQDLYSAIEQGELSLVYQPQIDYRDHRICGVEALLRWNHPQLGFVPPDQFIPLAEQNGSIVQIGEWVLDQACQQLREWLDQGFVIRMAVNLSTVQLHHAELPRLIDDLMRVYALPTGSLELEVTETGLMEDIASAAQHLASLRQSGALIAIDDFGTGYSSLSYLRSLPLDKIKVDRSFVNDLLESEDDAMIVKAIIQLARNLGMQVIAEGVESLAQEQYLIAQGCHEGQGYFYSKPLPAQGCLDFLREKNGHWPSIEASRPASH
ncbi:putative bifunctional diguanylate cyclase/phosphodiesterase [Pseudomonas matsuisoli]|uniref:cyclic-guanylate-specific phosphodiesterase n=1 Tax=Pseudomonas matsuisoli TaxID=1515666 RepID=A0A917PKY1_9PSED|nr:bifunctional diguanylate cyclase/phosphodiesterase [Pseudomonas matsuisoli]GGJ82768.1 GGDEF-domain containing protein [Pseudomonas matsuisoli]